MARVAASPAHALHCLAPAKINLVLRVLGRLPNGYHELWSVMQTVDLVDDLTIRVRPNRSGIRLQCDDPRLPTGQTNLIYQAVKLVLEKSRRKVGVEVTLAKRIPIGAGLGGGSSDAAAVMTGLAMLLGLDWSTETMMRLGEELGSDVPFFMRGPCALVKGWGQDVQSIELLGHRWIVLVMPSFSIRTQWAYARLDAHRPTPAPLSVQLEKLGSSRRFGWDDLLGLMENDFESSLFVAYPELERIKFALLAQGAEAALLSGSGSTVFGVFEDKDQAERAAHALGKLSLRTIVVGTRTATDRPAVSPVL